MPQDITTSEMFRRLIRLQKHSPVIAKNPAKCPPRNEVVPPKIEQLMISQGKILNQTPVNFK
jgi:hypothetical protein